MVGRTRSFQGSVAVTFHRDGEDDETRVVQSGERALKIALLMLAAQDYLQIGDRLTVGRADGGRDGNG
jgi:hypothetical protein